MQLSRLPNTLFMAAAPIAQLQELVEKQNYCLLFPNLIRQQSYITLFNTSFSP